MAADNKPVKTLKEEMQEDVLSEIIETFLPKIKPIIKPATAKFEDWIKKGRKIIITPVDGKVFLFVVKEEDIDEFSLVEGKEPEHTYDTQTFIQMLLEGKFNDLADALPKD